MGKENHKEVGAKEISAGNYPGGFLCTCENFIPIFPNMVHENDPDIVEICCSNCGSHYILGKQIVNICSWVIYPKSLIMSKENRKMTKLKLDTRMKRAMVAKGISIEVLAKKIGRGRRSTQWYVSARFMPKNRTIINKISKILHVPVKDIMEECEDKRKKEVSK